MSETYNEYKTFKLKLEKYGVVNTPVQVELFNKGLRVNHIERLETRYNEWDVLRFLGKVLITDIKGK